MNILLIAGHGGSPYDPGARAWIRGVKFEEAELTRVLVPQIAAELRNSGISAIVYDAARDAYADYKAGKLAANAAFWKYDYVLEVHFNACVNDLNGNGRTTGVEIYWPTGGEKSGFEEEVLAAVAGCGFTKRSAKAGNYAVINTAAKAGVAANLLEVCFIDDADDMRVYVSERQKIAKAIAAAIAKKAAAAESVEKDAEPVRTPAQEPEKEAEKPLTEADVRRIIAQVQAEEKLKNPDKWSQEAREWAEGNGIIVGAADGAKQYKAPCTREMMVQFLYRLAKMLEK